MLKQVVVSIILVVLVYELIEHAVFPLVWYALKGRKKSVYGVARLIGKTVEIKQWRQNAGQVKIDGELWKAESDVPLQTGGKAVVAAIDGITLKLKPLE